jgi:hypothetical protein
MGHIYAEPHHEASGFIPDQFSHAALVREIHIEAPYAHQGLIVNDAFWEKVEASYQSDPRMMLHEHQCPILDQILRIDRLSVDPSAVTTPTPPATTVWQLPLTSLPPTVTGTHYPVGPLTTISVPEPTSIIPAGIAALTISAYVVTRALRGRPQSASLWRRLWPASGRADIDFEGELAIVALSAP